MNSLRGRLQNGLWDRLADEMKHQVPEMGAWLKARAVYRSLDMDRSVLGPMTRAMVSRMEDG